MSGITSDTGPWGIVPRALILDLHGDATAVVVYALLSSHADRRSDDGWAISRKRIAEETGLAVSTVDKALRRLIASGWVGRLPAVGPDGSQGWNRYVVHAVNTTLVPTYEGGSTDVRGGSDVDTTPNQTPLQTHVTDLTTSRSLTRSSNDPIDSLFDRFWLAYPRKVGKPDARRAFRRAVSGGDVDGIAVGLERWRIYWEQRDEPEFVPHPATWLNQERWNDLPPRIAKKEPPGMGAIRRGLSRDPIIDVD